MHGKEERIMCYNCGCGMPDEDHGKGHAGVDPKGRAITERTFSAAASAFGMSSEDSKKNALDLLEEGEIEEAGEAGEEEEEAV
jgi:hypothetical protein